MGVAYQYGDGVEQDQEEAVRWYRLAADQGDARAQYNLGIAYWDGLGVNKDLEEAVRWTRLAADQGYAMAQNNLGVTYQNGDGVEQDQEEAVRWYRLAADQGNAIAQSSLGLAYASGSGVEPDLEEAVRWYRLAADQGNAIAQYMLAFAYQYGSGVEQNLEEAVHWYRLAAEQGSESAKSALAGLQDEIDQLNSFRLLVAQAEEGDLDAQIKLAEAYDWGNVDGVETDQSLALKWYRKAAEQGNTIGALHLAMSYGSGSNGLELDSSECFYWAWVSRSKDMINECGSRLSLDKQEKIRKKASKFRNKFNY